jgi:hypothetical protein
LTPDNFAAVYGSEVVEAEIQGVRKFFNVKSELDADTKSGDVVHCAIVHGFPANKDLPGMTDLGTLPPSFFHLAEGPVHGSAIGSQAE